MSKAILKFIRVAPLKARLIAREVQGMNAEYALASLEFTPNKAAKIISKVLTSALANGGLEAHNAIVKSCRVDRGPVLKRFRPRARGSASKIRKPMAHIFVEVGLQTATKKATNPQTTAKSASKETKAKDGAKKTTTSKPVAKTATKSANKTSVAKKETKTTTAKGDK